MAQISPLQRLSSFFLIGERNGTFLLNDSMVKYFNPVKGVSILPVGLVYSARTVSSGW